MKHVHQQRASCGSWLDFIYWILVVNFNFIFSIKHHHRARPAMNSLPFIQCKTLAEIKKLFYEGNQFYSRNGLTIKGWYMGLRWASWRLNAVSNPVTSYETWRHVLKFHIYILYFKLKMLMNYCVKNSILCNHRICAKPNTVKK